MRAGLRRHEAEAVIKGGYLPTDPGNVNVTNVSLNTTIETHKTEAFKKEDLIIIHNAGIASGGILANITV